MNISFYCRGIGAQLPASNDGRLFGLPHEPLVDLLGAMLAKERKRPAQITKIWNRVLIKAGEASIEKAGSQFALGPAFDVLEHHAAQQPIGRNPFAANFARAW